MKWEEDRDEPLFRTPRREDLEPHRIEWWFPAGLIVIVAVVLTVVALYT